MQTQKFLYQYNAKRVSGRLGCQPQSTAVSCWRSSTTRCTCSGRSHATLLVTMNELNVLIISIRIYFIPRIGEQDFCTGRMCSPSKNRVTYLGKKTIAIMHFLVRLYFVELLFQQCTHSVVFCLATYKSDGQRFKEYESENIQQCAAPWLRDACAHSPDSLSFALTMALYVSKEFYYT